MSDIIRLLPDSVANQIAAGEVIQRPASVIKELIENSVDAGATKIDVLVVDAGKTSIQVIDNGKGMSETDARLSFERHATSKIRQASDLFNLHTMGFRGEALASIAAVAQVELRTRTSEDQIGTLLNIEGSRVVSQEPVSCQVGCNFQVKNLFFNVPARRRFLKSNSTELNNIITAFERIVLVYPDIHFTFHSNGAEVYNLPKSGIRQRIIDVVGKKIDKYLLPVNVDTSLVQITGFVGKPESAKKKGASQYFFVNDRYMRHPFFHKAVLNAYERLVPSGEQVPYFIYMKVEPGDIDVNIHPVKTEIKFDNEHSIWQILLAGVREALGTFCEIPKLDFTEKVFPEMPTYYPNRPSANVSGSSSPRPITPSVPQNWESLYKIESKEEQKQKEEELFDTPWLRNEDVPSIEEKSPVHYQFKGSYIMTAVKSGLMIIDQHRAHIRILFDKLKEQKGLQGNTQKVLFPEISELTPSEVIVYEKISDTLTQMGFEIINLGGGSYSVNGIPADLKDVNPSRLFQDILESASNGSIDLKQEMYHDICLTLARSSACPYGQVLSNAEMEDIINRLFACENPNYTPDGKAIMNIIPQSQIEIR